MAKKLLIILLLILGIIWMIRVPLAMKLASSALGEEVSFETITPSLSGATLVNVTIKTKQATLKAKKLSLQVKPFTLLSNRLIVRAITLDDPTVTVNLIPRRISDIPSLKGGQENKTPVKAVTVERLNIHNLTVETAIPKMAVTIPELTLQNVHSDKLPLKDEIISELIRAQQKFNKP